MKKLRLRISFLFFIGIFVAGSTALGYYYYFVYSPPLKAAEQFMSAMESGSGEALRPEIIVGVGLDAGELREPTDMDIELLLSESFERGRILDQRRREGRNREYHYLVYREPDGRVFAIVVTEVGGRFKVVIPESPMSERKRYLWDYTWTN
jgi:hypothetical protein